MGIGVQSQSTRRAAQGYLYSFWMDILSSEDRGKRVPEIVKTYFKQIQFYQRLLKMPVDIPMGKRRFVACGKNKPTYFPIPSRVAHKSRHGNRTPGLPAFWFAKSAFIFDSLQCSLDARDCQFHTVTGHKLRDGCSRNNQCLFHA